MLHLLTDTFVLLIKVSAEVWTGSRHMVLSTIDFDLPVLPYLIIPWATRTICRKTQAVMAANGKRRNQSILRELDVGSRLRELDVGSRQLPVCGVTVCSTGGVVEQVFVYMVAGHQRDGKAAASMPIVVTGHHDIARSTAQHRRIAYRCVLF